MALFLFSFYPVLLPLLLYLLWLYVVRKTARKKDETPPRFRDGPMFWILTSSLLIAILCFVVVGFTNVVDSNKGIYIPAYMEGEKLVPAKVKP